MSIDSAAVGAAVQIPIFVEYELADGTGAIRLALKVVENGFRPHAAGLAELEDRSTIEGAAARSDSIKVAGCVENQAAPGIEAVDATSQESKKAVKNRFLPGSANLG